jgi:hypothetical protein
VALACGGNINNDSKFRVSDLMKTYTIINYLPQYGHVPSSFTTIISPMSWFSKNHKTFDFSDGASYIDPLMDVKVFDTLFNITYDIMSLKAYMEPWKRGREKNPIVIQQLIEACSSAQGHVLDLFVVIGEYQSISF